MEIPLSALLSPLARRGTTAASDAEPPEHRHDMDGLPTGSLPDRAAILGPLPPSAPLNAARWAVDAASLPPFVSAVRGGDPDCDAEQAAVPAPAPAPGPPRRALLVTGPRGEYHTALEDEDEPHLRTARREDARVDIRYCPTPGHARLLLTLLTSTAAAGGHGPLAPTAAQFLHASGGPSDTQGSQRTNREGVFDLPAAPVLIVLYDLLALFDENDENGPAGTMPFAGTSASAYLDLIAAARSAAAHLNCALLVLEPSAPEALPILPTTSAAAIAVPVPATARGRRVPLVDGLAWLLGADAVGTVRELARPPPRSHGDGDGDVDGDERMEPPREPETAEQGEDAPSQDAETATTTYTLTIGATTTYMQRRRVGKAQFAVAPGGDPHAVAWVWVWARPPDGADPVSPVSGSGQSPIL